MAGKNKKPLNYADRIKSRGVNHPQAALRSPKQEAFAQAFLVDFDGARAVIEAGYGAMLGPRILPLLLRSPKIQARLKTLQEKPFPFLRREHLHRALAARANVQHEHLFTRNPMTGEWDLDLARAAAKDLNSLLFEQSVTLSKGRKTTVTRIKSADPSQALDILAKNYGFLDFDPNAGEPDALTRILLRAQGTAFPVATERKREQDTT
ncbi:terminase small subunit [Sedimentimonas flavescens]|uniref:Terminase small subunit n=1 Tax=Sedimentimonas flavescens TaxID=2851012 RepID=A0ABT2ZVK6_9RHOB|nr:terminase small subunit [Sedimentimonas flavescens]MCV2877637.1 terminase small subunit [Sedimentimonas flavescens]